MAIEQAVKKAEKSMPKSQETKETKRSSSAVTGRKGNVTYADFKEKGEYGPKANDQNYKAADGYEKEATVKEYDKIKKDIKPYQEAAPKPTLVGRVKAAFQNTGNIAKNAFDNTIGYGIAKYQNYKTKTYFKRNPESDDTIAYLMHGMFQNEGSQRKLASQLRKAGYKPYHLKGHHHLQRKENADKAFEQIGEFHEYTELKDPRKRNDIYSGHSSGADIGIYMAGDKRMSEYGIRKVQARAPAPSGIEAKTLGQRILMPFVEADNAKYIKGKRNVVELHKRKPKVPVYVVAGKYDTLVPPSDAYYKHAKEHNVIDHPDSTHFGTSGVNSEMNEILIELMGKQPDEYKKKYKKAA